MMLPPPVTVQQAESPQAAPSIYRGDPAGPEHVDPDVEGVPLPGSKNYQETAPAGGSAETQAYGTVRPRDEHHEPESPGLPSRRRTANIEQLAEQWENLDQRDECKRET